VKIVNITIM